MSLFSNIFLQSESDETDDDMDIMPPFFPMEINFSDDKKKRGKEDKNLPDNLPILPLRNTVLFPNLIMPVGVSREKSLKAIQKAIKKKGKYIGVFAQKDPNNDNPEFEDLYTTGVIARVVKNFKMPDGNTTVILQGIKKITLTEVTVNESYLEGNVAYLPDMINLEDETFKASVSSLRDLSHRIVELSPNIPNEAGAMLQNMPDDEFFVSFITSNMNIPIEEKQAMLEQTDMVERTNILMKNLYKELNLLELKSQIESKTKGELDKQQRDYFLNQQLRTIQEELGQGSQEEEVAELIKRAEAKQWSVEVKERFHKELNRLRRTNPMAPDYAIIFNYLEMMCDLPWNEFTDDNFDLKNAANVLDEEHFGMEKVKDRILEHLAVLKMKGDMKAPIICLAGPPGVGKTSLGKSIATALGRKYIRMSLGGLHDEAEIRGHRKTYIGAMPGRIVQSIKKAKSSNPVFILDEIDKVGNSFRGDPTSALLEVLDPEQNTTFYDNYLELEYDLSKIMFIATANSLSTIQPALLDRMEIIELEGYSIEEKIEIGVNHLVPRQMENHGLKADQLVFSRDFLKKLIQDYTRESGVRELDRKLAEVIRRMVRKIASDEAYKHEPQPSDLEELLGIPRFSSDAYQTDSTPGVAIGLAWTQVGGDILFIEASLSKGKGKLTLTGNLGDVMKESATTALSFVHANCDALGISQEVLENNDIHIHVPAGAIPKDGPSAGITMLSAITSAYTKRPLRQRLAMTGEITLRGKVLPVGGIKEKVLAARRAGVTDIILCADNEKDVKEIKSDYISGLNFHYVTNMLEVINKSL